MLVGVVSSTVAPELFREQAGFKVGYKVFLKWYREKYPKDYAAVF